MTVGPFSPLRASGRRARIFQSIPMSTEERNRIFLEMQAQIEEAKAKEAVRTAERLAKYETIEIVINGRKYFKLIHKESGLGMWSHDVAIEEAKRNKAKNQQLNGEHP